VSSTSDVGTPTMTAPSEHIGGTKHDVAVLLLRLVAGAILLVHGLQHLSDPDGHIADTADFGVPLAPLTGWLSMIGEAGLGALLIVGLVIRIAGILAAVLMVLTFLVDVLSEGLIADQGVTSESALLIAGIGVGLALLGADRYSLSRVLRLPTRLR
jgi:putative oxidoreductase